MARKKKKRKGIFKKILKGIAVVGGTVLGAVTGISAIKGIVKGTGALAGIAKGIGNIKNKVVNVGQSARNLISGLTKEQRAILQKAKQDSRNLQGKITLAEKLMREGVPKAKAYLMAGVDAASEYLEEVTGPEPEKKPIMIGGMDVSKLLLPAAVVLGLFLLTRK